MLETLQWVRQRPVDIWGGRYFPIAEIIFFGKKLPRDYFFPKWSHRNYFFTIYNVQTSFFRAKSGSKIFFSYHGGARLFFSPNLASKIFFSKKYLPPPDINWSLPKYLAEIENVWVEWTTAPTVQAAYTVIVGVIYRHPGTISAHLMTDWP